MSEGAAWNEKIVEMARAFHDEYEVQAKRFGWQSQTPVPFDELPESNKQTMLNVIAQVVPWNVMAELANLRAQLAQRDGELEALRGKVVKVAAMHEPRPKSSRERGALPQGCSCGAHYWPCPTVAALSDNQEGRDE